MVCREGVIATLVSAMPRVKVFAQPRNCAMISPVMGTGTCIEWLFGSGPGFGGFLVTTDTIYPAPASL